MIKTLHRNPVKDEGHDLIKSLNAEQKRQDGILKDVIKMLLGKPVKDECRALSDKRQSMRHQQLNPTCNAKFGRLECASSCHGLPGKDADKEVGWVCKKQEPRGGKTGLDAGGLTL